MRRSLWAVLASFPDITLVGEADGYITAQAMSQSLKPDILIISADLPENEVTLLLRGFLEKNGPRPYSVVFVNTNRQRQQVLAAGADAVLWHTDSTRQLAETLRQFQVTQSASQSPLP
jgi:DNA-binding NarL/FixJ family response regulator